MNFRISFFNKTLFKSNIKRIWWVSALSAICMFLFGTMPFFNEVQYYERQFPEDISTELASYFSNGMYYVIPIIGIIAAVCLSALLFVYLNRANAVSCIHGLPVTRTELYFTHTLSALVLLIIPFIINCALWSETFIKYHISADVIFKCLYLYIIYSLLAFTLTTLVGMFTGNTAAQIVFSGVAALLPLFFTGFIVLVCDTHLYGFSSNSEAAMGFLLHYVYLFPDLVLSLSSLIYIAFILIMLFVGLAVYKLRALENHGEVIAFPKLKGLFSVLFSVCCGILGFFYMYTMWSNSNLLLMLPFALVGLIIANILVQKSFTLKGALKPFVASFVILLALIVGIHYDVTGFEKRVPDPGNVLYVEFSDNSVDKAYYLADGEKYYFADVFEPKYSTPEEIELFIDLHKHLIENPQHEDYDYSAPLARKFAHYSYFNFAYTLKNGSKMYRSYRLSGDEVNEYLSMILETKTYRAYQYPVLDGTEKTYVSATVNDVRSSAEDVEYTSAAEVEKIVQAIKKDRENISFEKMVSHRNSEIMTVYLSYEKQLVDSMGNSASDPAVLEDGYSITQDDANTIAVLKELGYFDKAEIHDSAEGMTGAVVWYGNEDLYYEYLQITKEQDNDMPETVDYSRDYADEYNKNIRFTDPEQLDALYKLAFETESDADYSDDSAYLTIDFEYPDGILTYSFGCYLKDMPDFLINSIVAKK